MGDIRLVLFNDISNPSLLINSFLNVWQRGTTITNPVNTYIADRVKIDGNGTFRARLGADNKPIGGAILTENIDCRYLMEHIDFEQLDGRKLTFSYSVDGHVISKTFIANVANCPFDGDGRRLAAFSPGAGTLDWFNCNIGDYAMPPAPRSIAEELALCQRYFQKISFSFSGAFPINVWFGNSALLPVTMRVTPTPTRIGGYIENLDINSLTMRGDNSYLEVALFTINPNVYTVSNNTVSLDAEL